VLFKHLVFSKFFSDQFVRAVVRGFADKNTVRSQNAKQIVPRYRLTQAPTPSELGS